MEDSAEPSAERKLQDGGQSTLSVSLGDAGPQAPALRLRFCGGDQCDSMQ